MKINIGISEKNREAVAEVLTTLLADEFVLAVKTKKFHWNVTGPSFMEMHKLFEGQYDQLEESIDEIAERIRQLGLSSIGSLTEFSKHATLKDNLDKKLSAEKMVKELVEDHETLIQLLRKSIAFVDDKCGDAGNADFLTGLLKDHEKTVWMLRSYLE